jgi:hypothetical protein
MDPGVTENVGEVVGELAASLPSDRQERTNLQPVERARLEARQPKGKGLQVPPDASKASRS